MHDSGAALSDGSPLNSGDLFGTAMGIPPSPESVFPNIADYPSYPNSAAYPNSAGLSPLPSASYPSPLPSASYPSPLATPSQMMYQQPGQPFNSGVPYPSAQPLPFDPMYAQQTGGGNPMYAQQTGGGNPMLLQQQLMNPSMIAPFNSAPIKLIAWAVLQCLLRIYREDTALMAPGENILSAGDQRTMRYKLATLAISQQVTRFTEMPNSTSYNYISSKLIEPILSAFHVEFPRYCKKTPLPPQYGALNIDPVLSQSVHRLHPFFSAAYRSFLPLTFTYNAVPLQWIVQFAHAIMKIIIEELFSRDPNSEKLVHERLFSKIAQSIDAVQKIDIIHFMEDRMGDNTFLDCFIVSNMIVEVLRKAAIRSLHHFAEVCPFLHSAVAFRSQLDMLYYSEKAY